MSSYKKVSIIIPAYNESRTIRDVVNRVKAADVLGLEKEIIIVDNHSQDGTREIIKELGNTPDIKTILHDKNEGVGVSWRDGMNMASGDILLRQDADTEYQPEDIKFLLAPILEGRSPVVYGSRILGFEKSKYRYQTYLWGGLLVNAMFNWVLWTRLTDALTASKAFDKKILAVISLKSAHFEIEAELTAKILRAGFSILEVPITYRARSFEEGKKIRWHHAFRILSTLFWYRFARKSP